MDGRTRLPTPGPVSRWEDENSRASQEGEKVARLEERMDHAENGIGKLRESVDDLKTLVSQGQVREAERWGEVMGTARAIKFLLGMGIAIGTLLVALAGVVVSMLALRH